MAVTAKEVLTMAALDLALTMSRTRQDSFNITGLTIKYLESFKTLNDYHNFFERIIKLLHNDDDDDDEQQLSISEILCDARIVGNLLVKQVRDKRQYWLHIFNKLDAYRRLPALSDDFVEMCENGEPYFGRIGAHIKLLASIVPAIYKSDCSHRLLELPVDEYIGYQIFQMNLELDQVELIAARLRVNLVHSILVNSCPRLELSCNRRRLVPQNHHRYSRSWGSVILNKLPTQQMKTNNSNIAGYCEANECVAEILGELVEALNRNKQNFTSMTERQYEEIDTILSKSQRIAKLDLSNLSFGNHTLTFFINVCNLMTLHAIVRVWLDEINRETNGNWRGGSHVRNQQLLRHKISLTTIGYDIGDLGTVSLYALRSKLLLDGNDKSGACNQDYTFLEGDQLNEPVWQDLDLPYDPRVLFALINEYDDTPIVRIYRYDTLNRDLNAALVDYFQNYAPVLPAAQQQVTLPWLVYKYMLDWVSNSEAVTAVKSPSRYRSITNVDEYLSSLTTSDAGFKIDCKTPNFAYDVKFSYNNSTATSNGRPGDQKSEKDEETSLWQTRNVKTNLLQYLEGHCWLLSYLLQRVHKHKSPTILKNRCHSIGNIERIATLKNLLKSPWIETIAPAFVYGVQTTAVVALRNINNRDANTNVQLWKYLNRLIVNQQSLEVLTFINALPDCVLMSNLEIQRLRDRIIGNVAAAAVTSAKEEVEEKTGIKSERRIKHETADTIMRYIYQIKDEQILAQFVINNISDLLSLPIFLCQQVLEHLLQHNNHKKLPLYCKSRINEMLSRLTLFNKILRYGDAAPNCSGIVADYTWYDLLYQIEKVNCPGKIVESLVNANEYELCFEWLQYRVDVPPFSLSSSSSSLSSINAGTTNVDMHCLMSEHLLVRLLKTDKCQDFKQALKLLRALPLEKSLNLCKALVVKLDESTNALRFIVRYLLDNSSVDGDCEKYRKYLLGIDILQQLEDYEKESRQAYLELIREPLVMLEQLLMNCRIDSLRRIITAIRRSNRNNDHCEVIENFDVILRFYARKSLDIRVAALQYAIDPEKNRNSSTVPTTTSEAATTAVIESLEDAEFSMPVNIPTKDEWVPNDKVLA